MWGIVTTAVDRQFENNCLNKFEKIVQFAEVDHCFGEQSVSETMWEVMWGHRLKLCLEGSHLIKIGALFQHSKGRYW